MHTKLNNKFSMIVSMLQNLEPMNSCGKGEAGGDLILGSSVYADLGVSLVFGEKVGLHLLIYGAWIVTVNRIKSERAGRYTDAWASVACCRDRSVYSR